MSDFIYNEQGGTQAFRIGDHLYDMRGKAVGRISAERVYRLNGSYVGELFRNMVVEKPVGVRPSLPPISVPGDVEPPSADTSRGGGSLGFPDVFQRLLDDNDGG